ncbi:site-specific integrase [Flavobacterium sediminilitoris]|uniref:Site-specific integrase n=1 Tax=Flavobacterium sediminilitoris TaxID=2024526 RepID=A0ABY4HIP5_9FLAO|nr:MULTISPECIES: site-specific integrase [Flavobacterium]UOX32438.1 site-specific integrase [Flavobacterium sediminilitoris]
MLENKILINNYPINYPIKMNGKLSYKVKIKKDHIRVDGTCAIYVQCFLNSNKKMFPVNISVKPSEFDDLKQRVKTSNKNYKDYNIIIEKLLSQIHEIELNYRLTGMALTMENLVRELTNPTSWIDFIQFWDEELVRQKGIIKDSTLRQQRSAFSKLKEYKETIYFHELNEEFFEDILKWLRTTKKNGKNTIASFIKNFKKYLHIAQKRGIRTPLSFDDIKTPSFKGNRTFLDALEITQLYKYYNSEFINETHKTVIAMFLFSCFSGLRISDILRFDKENIIGDYIVFVAQKTEKLQRITLNNSAKKFLEGNLIFNNKFTGEYINRTLKDICKITGIKKRVSFHVARHTFATNFLISGGRIEVLQKILGHSKIEETMIYVHIVESISNEQMFNLDDILNINAL